MTIGGAGKNRGIEGVGKTIPEHQAQLGIGDACTDAGDGSLDSGAGEAALGRRGTLVQICWIDLRNEMTWHHSSHGGDRCRAAQKCATRGASVCVHVLHYVVKDGGATFSSTPSCWLGWSPMVKVRVAPLTRSAWRTQRRSRVLPLSATDCTYFWDGLVRFASMVRVLPPARLIFSLSKSGVPKT